MRTYYETSFVRIDADEKLSVLLLHWKPGKVSNETYKAALLEGLRLVDMLGLHYWVSNQKQMATYSLRLEAWTCDTWFTYLAASSVIGILLVESNDPFNRQVTRHILSRPEARRLPLKTIDSAYEALEWIAGQALVPAMVLNRTHVAH